MTALIIISACLLAYANGANDNLKGVATLLGSGTTNYRGALAWGTISTFAGSLCALIFAGQLVKAFSGKGIVADSVLGDPAFLVAVGSGAMLVVLAATALGLPVSTTHALVGGLAGGGLAAAGTLMWINLARTFLLPMLISPLLAALLVAIAYPAFKKARQLLGTEHDTCICIEAGVPTPEELPATGPAGSFFQTGTFARISHQSATTAADAQHPAAFSRIGVLDGLLSTTPRPSCRIRSWALHLDGLATKIGEKCGLAAPRLEVAAQDECRALHHGKTVGLTAQKLLDSLHFLSAGAVSFARGLNDTPKIAALLLATGALAPRTALWAVATGMAAGAVLQAVKVATTMSFDITEMNSGQGFTANLATAVMVFGASRLGVPVSTTHVSVGALFGLGGTTGGLDRKTMGRILMAWFFTLPLAALAAAAIYMVISSSM